MLNIRELSFDEIAQVSGGGNAGDHPDKGTGATNYGGQANGFQPNYAAGAAGANMYNDLTSPCGAAIIAGSSSIASAALSGNPAAIGLAAIGSAASITATCDFNSNSSSRSGVPFR